MVVLGYENSENDILYWYKHCVLSSNKCMCPLTLNLPTTTIVAQPFNVIKWQLKFNPVA